MDNSSDLRPFLRTLDGVMRATFGPGAIGRIGTVALSSLVVLGLMGVILAFLHPFVALAIVFAVVVITMSFFLWAFRYADRHPTYAAMDGTQIAKVMMQDAAAKALPGAPPIVIDAQPIENPKVIEKRAAGEVPDA